jgi:hypothetical protein
MAVPYLTIPNKLLENNEELEFKWQVQEEVQEKYHEEFIVHKWYATDSVIQDYANYAYEIWWMEFVKLIECENGRRDPDRISKTHDHWLCQLNYNYNKKFINSSEFSDPYKQLDYCYEKYKINPDLRYWPDRRIEWKKCTDFVDDRFDIILI